MKKLFALFLLCGAIATGAIAYAQYDPHFVGPQQQQADPFAQNGSGQTTQCGPQANGNYILCEEVSGLLSQTQTDFVSFLRELYILAFILAGTVAFVRIVYGGILYSWSGVVDRKKEAIKIFWDVAYGMLLLMGSYLLLNTINPALTAFNLPATPNILQGQGIGSAAGPAKNPYALSTDDLSPEQEAMLSDIETNKTLTEDAVSALEDIPPDKKSDAEKARLSTLKKNLSSLEAQSKGLAPQQGSQDNLLRDMYEMNLKQNKPKQ